MPPQNTTKKNATKKPALPKLKKLTAAQLKANAMPIDQVMAHSHPQAAAINDLPFLGFARAVVIVTHAAQTNVANLQRTLAQLGVNGPLFRARVAAGIAAAGYKFPAANIPSSPSTTLFQCASVIQNAPKA